MATLRELLERVTDWAEGRPDVRALNWAVAEGTDDVLRLGFQLLLDRDGLLGSP